MYRYPLIGLLLSGLTQWTVAASLQEGLNAGMAYRLNDLAMAIADEHVVLRVDLARIALGELAAIYDEEAAQAYRDMRRQKNSSGLRRWAAAVKNLANDYASLAASVSLTTPVEISIGAENSLYLTIDGRLVAISSPRMNEQAEFESRVIEQFCALNRCEGLLAEAAVAMAVPRMRHGDQTRWSFSTGSGPVCETDHGLYFQFMNMENLGRKREACTRTVAELNTLAAALARKVDHGVRVDWDRIMIRSMPDGDEYISLNREGDYLRESLPALAQRRELFRVVRPWLAAQAKGLDHNLVVLHAGRLLGLPGYPLE